MKGMVGKAAVVLALLAVLGGLAAWLAFGDDLMQAGKKPPEDPVLTAPVVRGSVQKTVTGIGEAKASATEKLRPADSWHWLESFDAPLNKRVAAGQTLVTYANGDTWAAPYDLVVTAYELPGKNKGAVTKGDHFIEVHRIDSMAVTLQVSETDLASVAEGQAVTVRLGADESRVYEGTSANVNEVGTFGATGSKFTVTVAVPNDGSIKLGMSANLSITVAEAADVLTVPVSAVSGTGDGKYVEVVDGEAGTPRRVAVVTGISDGLVVEVSGEGLQEGDAVVLNEADAPSDEEGWGEGLEAYA